MHHFHTKLPYQNAICHICKFLQKFDAHSSNWKREKEKKKEKNIWFKTFLNTCNIMKHFENFSECSLNKLNVSRNEVSKPLKSFFLFNTQSHKVCKSQVFPQIK